MKTIDYNDLIGKKLKSTKDGSEHEILNSNYDEDLDIYDVEANDVLLSLTKEELDSLFGSEEVFNYILISEEKPEEKPVETSFSSADNFVKEYKDYLVGKKIAFNDNEGSAGGDFIIKSISSKGHDLVTINTEEVMGINIDLAQLEDFINGEKTDITYNAKGGYQFMNEDINLILQEETPVVEAEKKLNSDDYRYYLVDNKLRIIQGFEYKEDARKVLKYELGDGKIYQIKSKRELIDLGINPYDNCSWGISCRNEDIIKEAFDHCLSENILDEEEVVKMKTDNHWINMALCWYLEFLSNKAIDCLKKGNLVKYNGIEKKQSAIKDEIIKIHSK